MQRFLDWLHNNTCGDDTIFFRIYEWFYAECPCCHWWRGVGFGAVIGFLVGAVLL